MAWRLLWPFLIVSAVTAYDYGVLIDAGSSGSRLHFYRWPQRVADPLDPQYAAVSIPEEIFQIDVEPGVSHFATNTSGLSAYFDKLLSQAMPKIQGHGGVLENIPIYLKATAGCRDLYQDQRDSLFGAIRKILRESPFIFGDDYWARTISGEEEGSMGWLSVNTIKGTFRQALTNSWGAVDMGGASTQITFAPKDVSLIQNLYPLRLSNTRMNLYTHSYLQFGYVDSHFRVVKSLREKGGDGAGSQENPIRHPCFPKGATFLFEMREPFVVQRGTVWITGVGDVEWCKAVAGDLLDDGDECFVPAQSRLFAVDSRKGACGIGSTYQPNVRNSKFIALSEFTNSAKDMGIPLEEFVPLSRVEAGMMRLCSGEDSEGEQDFESELQLMTKIANLTAPYKNPMSFKVSKCWKAVWIWNVLSKGYQIPSDTKQVMFAETLDGQAVDWSLGAMMHEVNYYPWVQDAQSPPVGISFAGLPSSPALTKPEEPAAEDLEKTHAFLFKLSAASVFSGLGIGYLFMNGGLSA